MYIHLGSHISVSTEDIVAVFDLDNVTTGKKTREFLAAAEREGMIIPVGEDLPKSLVVCTPKGSWQRLYLSPLSATALLGRLQTASTMR